MKKAIIIFLCHTFCTSLSFAASVFNIDVNVPFSRIKIHPNQMLIIHYNNTQFWDGIVCGCPSGEKCLTYTASWKFKEKNMLSLGPNYYDKLILNFGFSPEAPPQNADLKGKIKLTNIGKKIIPIECYFDFSS